MSQGAGRFEGTVPGCRPWAVLLSVDAKKALCRADGIARALKYWIVWLAGGYDYCVDYSIMKDRLGNKALWKSSFWFKFRARQSIVKSLSLNFFLNSVSEMTRTVEIRPTLGSA